MDQIVSLETAKLAMEVGFKENVTHLYLDGENILLMIATAYTTPPYRVSTSDIETPPEELLEDGVPAPTQTALSRWLREKNDMYVSVDMMAFKRGWIVYIISMPRKAVCFKAKDFDTYEEALEEGLKQACKIVKDRRGNE
jgi:hypothetical protein